MSDDDELQVPRASAGDRAHTLARAGLGTVPIAGAALAELFAAIVLPPLARRRDAWMEAVGKRLRRLEDRVDGLRLEDLADDESFVTTAVQATTVALRTHQEEKRDALRNAVVNAALTGAPDDDLRQVFLNAVDELTPVHLRLLAFLDDPAGFAQRRDVTYPSVSMGDLSTFIEVAMPELQGRRDLYDLAGQDLHRRGLTNTGGLHATMTESGLYAQRTTALGRQFLAFIAEPPVLAEDPEADR